MGISRTSGVLVVGLVVALVIGGVISGFAADSPDGLERVAEDEGFDETAEDHAFGDLPVADYGIEAIDNDRLSVGIAGVLGVLVTFALGTGVFLLVRALGRSDGADDTDAPRHRSGDREPAP